MPNACLSLWPTEECQWNTWDIWRSSDLVERAIYLGLAIMLVWTLFTLLRFIRSSISMSRAVRDSQAEFGPEFQSKRIRLISDLIPRLGTLKGMAVAAPFLGLAGTSYGILAALSYGGSWSRGSFLYYICRRLAFTLAATIVGILVAILAIICHNVLRSWVEVHVGRVPAWWKPYARPDCRAQTLPLRRRFSALPHYGLLAAPILGCWLMVIIGIRPYPSPVGLRVRIGENRCESGILDQLIVLRLTDDNKLFINHEEIDRNHLAIRLSDIYRLRTDRELYLDADGAVPFQDVADAIDLSRNSLGTGSKSPHITVRLISPRTSPMGCPVPRLDSPKKYAPR